MDEIAAPLTFGPRRPWGVTWIAGEPPAMMRASHALVVADRVWLVDPVDGPGLDAEIAALGRLTGVIQLLDRHLRDCAAVAARHGVPHVDNPLLGVPDAPFIPLPLTQRRWWHEVALWWPRHRLLVVPEAVGTAPLFLAPDRRLGVHPALRLAPPRPLAHLEPAVLLTGHGPPLEDGDVAGDLRRAVAESRREIPAWMRNVIREWRASRAEEPAGDPPAATDPPTPTAPEPEVRP